MNQQDQQQVNVGDPQTTSLNNNASTSEMYNQAVQDIKGLPILGRIALAVCIIIVLFKLTPILDLFWLFIQIVVIPCLLLISVGVISHETYMVVIGWLNESLVWARNKRDEIQGAT